MQKKRIIARLDIKSSSVVKGIHFEGLRVIGEPGELAKQYYEQGADELLYVDTVASLYGRNNLTEIVKKAASHIFVPMTVGGGIRSVKDALTLLHCGADKVAVNTAAVRRPELLTEIAHVLGSQALVASLQVKRTIPGEWEVYIDNGRERTGINALDWAKKVEEMRAGEILVTSVDMDGTAKGFDIEIVARVIQAVSIPVIAGGGARTNRHIIDLVRKTDVDAVAVASMLHYRWGTIPDIKGSLLDEGIITANH